MTDPTHAAMFAGIGGGELAFDREGFVTVWNAEYDPTPSKTTGKPTPLGRQFPARVLAHRFPGVPNYGDVRLISGAPTADVITFGSPCQDLSSAGRRAGLAGSRSHLFFDAARVIRECAPTFAIWENVGGALTSNAGLDFRSVLDTMVELGATDVAWRVFDSQYSGVPQQRRRVYLVADFGGRRAGEILFESERCEGHHSPRGASREELASTLTSSPRGAGRPGGSHDTDLVARAVTSRKPDRGDADERELIAATVTSKWAKGSGGPAGDEVQNLTFSIHPDALHRDGVSKTASDDGAGLVRKRDAGLGIRADDQAYTLTAGEPPAVAFEPRHFTRGKAGPPSEIVPALTADADRGDGQALVFDPRQITSSTNRSNPETRGGSISHTLHPKDAPTLYGGTAIRRFTPLECERLQGFPDGWTCLCGAGVDVFACKCPDGPRYRALGNAFTVNVAQWIARRMRPYFD